MSAKCDAPETFSLMSPCDDTMVFVFGGKQASKEFQLIYLEVFVMLFSA